MDHFILMDGHTHAIAKSALHHHGGEHEAWIDVIFGPFGNDSTEERVSFGCHVYRRGTSKRPATGRMKNDGAGRNFRAKVRGRLEGRN